MSTTSDTSICNMALSHLGQGLEVGNYLTEQSAPASACRRFYEVARDATLRDFNWPFAKKYAFLNLVQLVPTSEWGLSYRMPTDCLYARRIVSGVRFDTAATRVQYDIARDAAGELIYTDQQNAQLEYTMRMTDPSKYNAQFVMAFSVRLAIYMLPRINSGDPFKQRNALMQLYNFEVSAAQAAALNEVQGGEPPDSQFILTRY